MFDTQEVAWADISVRVFDTTIKALRGSKYSKEKETEALYAAGSEPVGIQEGNNKYEGSLKVLKSGLDMMNEAARSAGYRDITDVPYQAIVITTNFKEGFGRPMRTDVKKGVKFSKYEKNLDQGAKFMEVELPYLYLQLTEK